jgi:hypothetical protein
VLRDAVVFSNEKIDVGILIQASGERDSSRHLEWDISRHLEIDSSGIWSGIYQASGMSLTLIQASA